MIRKIYNDQLFVGDAVSARNLGQIYQLELQAIVDVALEEAPALLGRDLVYCRFPLSDDGSNDPLVIEAAVTCLRSLLESKRRTLVACSAGMSRSPLIAAAALSLVTENTLSDCLAEVTANAPRDVSPSLYESVAKVIERNSR